MPRAYRQLTTLGLVFWGLLSAGAAHARLSVFVSVPPLEAITERIGGDHVDVSVMVGPGQNPHSYEPTPRQIVALAGADLYVRTGVSFEEAWMSRIQAVNPDMPVIDLRQRLSLRRLAEHHGADTAKAQRESEVDPHVWTSPLNARAMAEQIREQLQALDPGHGRDYAANWKTFSHELDALHREIMDTLRNVSSRTFLVQHPAWGYFADAYGLSQLAIEHEGKEPSAKGMVRIIERAKREGIKVVFVQPQLNHKAAAQVASAIGGRVEVLDPLAKDYLGMARRAAAAIARSGTP